MLFEHFRLQYVEVGVVVIIVAAVLHLRGYFDVAAIATLVNLLPVVADLRASTTSIPPDGTSIRVLVLNVHTESTSFEQVRQLIADEKPDLIGLVEVDRRWLDAIAPAVAAYPGRIEEPRPDNFGIALYARGRVVGAAEELGSSLPSVVADVAIGDAKVRAIVTHPLPPMSAAALDHQQAQLDAIAVRARADATPLLLMGDFNATPWSRPFLRLLRRSALCDSRAGFGVQASFPATSLLLRIPIDHVLASCTVGVRDRRIGRDVGSDHLPVIVDLVVPSSK
ncbi:MAG: endonuclease/exonuclease/phosphatase family protein [Kofleriaceae bacterium]